MGFYFKDSESILSCSGNDLSVALNVISNHYVKNNPRASYTLRPFHMKGLLRDKESRYRADFNRLFPSSENEQFVYVWGCYRTDFPVEHKFDITPFGPVTVFCNGRLIYQTDIFCERYTDSRVSVILPFVKGNNQLVIRFKKTPAGFGGIFGTWLGKLNYYFTLPGKRGNTEGFYYTEPLSTKVEKLETITDFSDEGNIDGFCGCTWLPRFSYSQKESKRGSFERIFGHSPGQKALAKTSVLFPEGGSGSYTLKGEASGPFQVYLENQLIAQGESGNISLPFESSGGKKNLLLISECGSSPWNCSLSIESQERILSLENPWIEEGDDYPWLYAGTFGSSEKLNPEDFSSPDLLLTSENGPLYWMLDFPGGRARLYNDNPLYGHWNYPLGVTLFGLLRSALIMKRQDLVDYVKEHVQKSIDTFEYALWDKTVFGGSTAVHHLLSSIDSLDDCGSFAATLLETAENTDLQNFRKIADFVADYISTKQIRLKEGTFFRKNLMHHFHEDTLWADDLYMSIPFLIRYSSLRGDPAFIDDAARQFLGFRKHLFLPEWNIMSHVFDFKRGISNGVPWGRGNGWVLFSLSELLIKLPQNHPLREELVSFFLTLSKGYLDLQDPEGMWHQVLNERDSYPETSCTAMFLYSFSIGLQLGLYENPAPYMTAVEKAWDGLAGTSIDREGNVHGVCRGSEFSFSPEYYRDKLLWRLNDTHGIGIVLLAGSAYLNLKKFQQKSSVENQKT